MKKFRVLKLLLSFLLIMLLVYACRQENFLNEKEANNKVNSNIRILKLSQIPKVEKYLKKQIGREDFQIPMEKHGKTSKLGLDLASISTYVVVEKVLGDRVYYVLGIVNTKIANEIYNVEIKQQKGVLESIRIIGYKSKRGKTKDFIKFTGTVSSYRIDGDPISSVDYTDGIGDCSPGGGGEPTYNGSEDPSPGDGGNYSSGSGNGYDGTEPISSSDCWDRVADRDEPWLTVGYYNNCTGQFISLYGVESLTPDCGDGSGVIIVDPPTECKGGKIKDASGNCVCPQGKEENSFGNCVTPCDTSKEDLKKVFPNANDIVLQDMANAINKYGKDFGIDTKEKLQHFLAQAGHESAKFTVFTENLNYRWEKLGVSNFKKYFNPISSPNLDPNKANPNDYKRSSTSAYVNSEKLANYVYGNRMGNDTYGDGYKYRGRGIFQLTGKSNYTTFNNFYRSNYDSSVDIINNPDLLINNKEIMVISALWYYKNNVLNRIKVNENTSVTSVSVIVNGGTNGLNDRIQIFNIAINIIKCL